jgi:hypothetical protein
MNGFATLASSVRLRSVAIFAAVALAACESTTGIPDGLSIEALVVPEVVAPSDSLVARLRIRNLSASPMDIRWSGCFALPVILKDGVVTGWNGTRGFCVEGGVTSFAIPAGGEHLLDYSLGACLNGPVEECVVPAEPGAYTLRFEPNAWVDPGRQRLPSVETQVVVRK